MKVCRFAVRPVWVGIAFVSLTVSLSAAAEVAIAPVVVEGPLGEKLQWQIERQVVRAVQSHGSLPVLPDDIRELVIGLDENASQTNAWWISAGQQLGVQAVLVTRADTREGAIHIEVKVIDVASGKWRRVTVKTTHPALAMDVQRAVDAALGSPHEADVERELADVEQALGRGMDLQYQEYLAVKDERHASFAWHRYEQASKRRRNGALLAAIAPPLILGATLAVALPVFRPWDWHEPCDEDSEHACTDADAYSRLGFMLVVAMGSAGTIATLSVGLIRHYQGREEMRKLRPLLKKDYSSAQAGPILALAPLFTARGPVGLALQGRF
jgi:hypothetical protein